MNSDYKLVITGANSAILASDFNEPVQLFDTKDEAEKAKDKWVKKWLADGYHLTAAGIYLNGSEWRRAAIYPVIQGKG